MTIWEILTRREAAANGFKKYYTGRRCKYGHVSQRYTSTGTCVSCGNANNRKYRKLLSLSHMGEDALYMEEFKVFAHRDDMASLRAFSEALAAARALMPGAE